MEDCLNSAFTLSPVFETEGDGEVSEDEALRMLEEHGKNSEHARVVGSSIIANSSPESTGGFEELTFANFCFTDCRVEAVQILSTSNLINFT